MPNRRLTLIALLGWLAGQPAEAQDFPNKPIRMVVPFPAGGSTDFMARVLAKELSGSLGQSVVIDNRTGAQGWIGADTVATSPADGYTIGFLPFGFAATAFVQKTPFDPRELKTVAMVASMAGLLSVNASVPVHTLADILKLARAKPGQLSYGDPGRLGAHQLAMELFKLNNKVDIPSVPYRGAAPALVDVMGGHLEMTITGATSQLGYIKEGKIRPIATTGAKRSSATPDVPTFAESGQPGFDMSEKFGVFAPPRTSTELVNRLSREIRRALATPAVIAAFANIGAEPASLTPDESAALYLREIEKMGKLINTVGLKAE